MEPSVERRTNLPYDEFVSEYFIPRKPVIVTDAVHDWRALQWTPAFFREEFGDRVVRIDEEEYRLREVLDAIEGSTSESPAPYLRSAMLRTTFPELSGDVLPPHQLIANNWLRLLRPYVFPRFNTVMNDLAGPDIFIGGPGAKLRHLHQDVFNVESFITQFYGVKKFIFFSPEDTKYLYPNTGLHKFRSGIEDPFVAPDLDRFPLFSKATPMYCALEPGETLYVPCFWWHSSMVLTTSINGVFSVVNARNWSDYVDDVAFRLRFERFWWWTEKIARVYLTQVGKILAWRNRNAALQRSKSLSS